VNFGYCLVKEKPKGTLLMYASPGCPSENLCAMQIFAFDENCTKARQSTAT
jgi:hypothetical protein